MLNHLIGTALPGLVIAASFSARAASSASLPILTLDATRAIVSAEEAKAAAEHWPCVVAIVDSEGLPIITECMADAATQAGVYLAQGKARTSALFRRPSNALEHAINGHRPAAATARGFVMMTGGPNIQLPAPAASSSPYLAAVSRAPALMQSL